MEIGTELDSCILIYDGKTILDLDENTRSQYSKYTQQFLKIKIQEHYNIWYDTIDKKMFSGAQFVDTRNAGKDQHFYSSKDRFKQNINSYIRHLVADSSPFRKQEAMYDGHNHDYFYTNPKAFKKFKDKTIMIVGGGPSTNSVNWKNIEYDYLWTCNQFNRNDKLKNAKIDLVSLAPLVDGELKKDAQLEAYFAKHSETIAAFPVDRSGYNPSPVLNFANRYIDQACLYHTRYGSVVGTMNRLIVLALLVGAKSVYFVGMDGRSKVEKDGSLLHAFDGDKPVPGWWKTYGHRFQTRQFVVFYDYIMSLRNRSDFELYNLGEGHEYNASTPMTQKLFPLTDEIKERVGINSD